MWSRTGKDFWREMDCPKLSHHKYSLLPLFLVKWRKLSQRYNIQLENLGVNNINNLIKCSKNCTFASSVSKKYGAKLISRNTADRRELIGENPKSWWKTICDWLKTRPTCAVDTITTSCYGGQKWHLLLMFYVFFVTDCAIPPKCSRRSRQQGPTLRKRTNI